ncbi:hypothetical protein [Sneathiella aquimaris]|uniref:hypothetical protein n=1 Tax=Sneathiella aquimaris TaxID=2599305 RepID=UPI00146C925B|nr:hypothetical protein [Sneathiella aquimaris]
MAQDFEDTEEALDLIPSDLDEATHAEMLALYRESTRTMLFAKTRQWRTLGAACLSHAALVTIGHLLAKETFHHQALVILSFLISAISVCILVIYQFWQHTEMQKLRRITGFLSSYFQHIRHIKSRSEANIHRYILLVIMIISIVVSNTIAYIAYLPLLSVGTP